MRIALALFPLLGGCYATMPTALMEGTEVLPPHSVGLSISGGGAGTSALCSGCTGSGGAGGEARLRVALPSKQEIGVSGFGGFIAETKSGGTVDYLVGGRLSYKVAPVPWLAIIAGGGAVDQQQTAVIGGDLAVVVAPYTSATGTQLYTGARGTFGVPVLQSAHGASEALTIPVGLAWRSGGDVRVFMEGGFIAGFGQFHDEKDAANDTKVTSVGGYLAFGVLMIIR